MQSLNVSDIISSSNLTQKVCPRCGRKYSDDDNFCSKHSDLVKLVYVSDLVKICPKCHKKYTKEDNYCGIHDVAIELCYIKDLVKQCKACGSKYPEDYDYCIRCEWDEKLEVIGQPDPPKRNWEVKEINFKPNAHYNFKSYSNTFTELEDLLSDENIEKLFEFNILQTEFDDIINNIKLTYKLILDNLIEEYNLDFDGLHLLDKMLLFSKCFVKTDFKEGGGDLGRFAFNEIYIDDRLEDALQITTILHELSHFLLAEILEQVVSIILDTNKTDSLEGFVCYTLVKDDFNYLVDEYCAHTVEGRFAVLGYQDYGSYKEVLKRFSKDYTEAHIDVANTIGNTFAWYIKSIMESFISEDLREEIKDEFVKLNDSKKYGELKYETNDFLKWDKFKQAIKLILTSHIEEFISNPNDIEKLYAYSIKFKQSNK